MKRQMLAQMYQKSEANLLAQISKIASETEDLIDLSLGDPDITTNQKIIEAAFSDVQNGHTHYTAANGSNELLQAIQAYYQRTYQLSFELSQIRATVGALHGLFLVLEALLDPDDEVIIHEPFFSPYAEQVRLVGGKPVIIPTFEEQAFELDLDRLEKAVSNKTKALILNSPNNPTGAVFSEQTLRGIAKLAEKYQFYILADEVYEAFVFDQTFQPMARFAPEYTITFGSFSKSFAMTGWRLGYVIAPTYLNNILRLINENVTYSAPTPSQRAGIYALNHAEELLPETVQLFKERVTYIEQRVKDIPALSLNKVKGSLYAFINIEKTDLDSVAFTEKLIREAKVLVVPGEAFGSAGKSYIRLAVTQDLATLKTAFDRIEKIL